MEDVLIFPPFQVERKELCYKQVPVSALERLYLTEFGTPQNESVLSCGSAIYGSSDDKEIRPLRRFSDVDYMVISKNGNKKPHYKIRKNSKTYIEALTFGYDSCKKGLENGLLNLLLKFVRFVVPLFDSEDSLEITSMAMSKMLEICLFEDDALITPSYAMMKINDARIHYEPYRWWSVDGEFVSSPNATKNIEVYYDIVASIMEQLCEGGSLTKVDSCYLEPVYDASNFVKRRGRTPVILDMIGIYSWNVLTFLRGGNIPTRREIVHLAYDGFNSGIGILKGRNNCTALFNAKPQTVKVQVH